MNEKIVQMRKRVLRKIRVRNRTESNEKGKKAATEKKNLMRTMIFIEKPLAACFYALQTHSICECTFVRSLFVPFLFCCNLNQSKF